MVCGRVGLLGGSAVLCEHSLTVHFVFDLKSLGLLHTNLVHRSSGISGDSMVLLFAQTSALFFLGK